MAKLGTLRAVAHNICDSLSSGIGLMIGVYEIYLYDEVASSPEGYLTLDFLNGQCDGATPSKVLREAFQLYRLALPEQCAKAGVLLNDFTVLKAKFAVDQRYGGWFTVWVETPDGRTAEDVYAGRPARHVRSKRRQAPPAD